jgi:hypothetical protein
MIPKRESREFFVLFDHPKATREQPVLEKLLAVLYIEYNQLLSHLIRETFSARENSHIFALSPLSHVRFFSLNDCCINDCRDVVNVLVREEEKTGENSKACS